MQGMKCPLLCLRLSCVQCNVLGEIGLHYTRVSSYQLVWLAHDPRAPGPYCWSLPLKLPRWSLGEEHGGVCRGEVGVFEQTAFAKALASESLKALGRNTRASWGRRLGGGKRAGLDACEGQRLA